MAYKTLLTILTTKTDVQPTLAAAVAVARQEDAHLDVLCIGVDRTQVSYYYEGAAAFVQQDALDRAREAAEDIEALARGVLEGEDIRWGVEALVSQLGSLGTLAAMRSRFADLVVLPRPYGEDRGPDQEVALEAALFDGGVPVLVLPEAPLALPLGRRIVLAWNESEEALSAARKALPLLRAATSVNVTVVEPPRHGSERSDPGGALSQWLVRHGVKAEVSVLARTVPRISEVILRHAMDIDADLIVMGAYGHSRLREAILGGATRYMLETAKLPVVMAH